MAIAMCLPLGELTIPTSFVADPIPRTSTPVPVLCAIDQFLGSPAFIRFCPLGEFVIIWSSKAVESEDKSCRFCNFAKRSTNPSGVAVSLGSVRYFFSPICLAEVGAC